MGSGQSATNVVTGAAGDLGRSLGENALGAGNARASGYIGSANAYTNAINQMGNLGAQYYGMGGMGAGAGARTPASPIPYGGYGAGRGGVG